MMVKAAGLAIHFAGPLVLFFFASNLLLPPPFPFVRSPSTAFSSLSTPSAHLPSPPPPTRRPPLFPPFLLFQNGRRRSARRGLCRWFRRCLQHLPHPVFGPPKGWTRRHQGTTLQDHRCVRQMSLWRSRAVVLIFPFAHACPS
jgi:hypothetical protein